MGNINNPAGRLHALLTQYQEQASKDASIHQTWCTVLDVDKGEGDLLPRLAEVAALIPAIERAITQGGHTEQQELFDTFSRQWAMPMLAADHPPRNTPSPGPTLVDRGALAALGALSVYLASVAPEGVVPDDERATELRGQVEELIRELQQNADTLPPQLAEAINYRLHDILWAMDHVRIGGPGAVEAATERLLGQIRLHLHDAAPEVKKGDWLKKVMKVVGVVWVAYKAGPEARAALEGWQDILEDLPALPPGS